MQTEYRLYCLQLSLFDDITNGHRQCLYVVLKKIKFVTNFTQRIKILIRPTLLLKGPTVITISLMTKNHKFQLLSKKNDLL